MALNFSFSLTPVAGNPEQVTLADTTTNWGGSNPARANCALVVGTELLSPWQAEALMPEMGLLGYDPRTFLSAVGTAIQLSRPQDGVLRVIVAVVPIVADANISALAVDTGYCTTDGIPKVRGVDVPAFDIALQPQAILGEGTSTQVPSVLAYAINYYLWDQGFDAALANLNYRYLTMPAAQQAQLLNLYERALLIATGAGRLYDQHRYLDCAAVLEGGRKLLVTNGQAPDAYAPLLSGYFPNPAVTS